MTDESLELKSEDENKSSDVTDDNNEQNEAENVSKTNSNTSKKINDADQTAVDKDSDEKESDSVESSNIDNTTAEIQKQKKDDTDLSVESNEKIVKKKYQIFRVK